MTKLLHLLLTASVMVLALLQSLAHAQLSTQEKVETLLQDMWSYYETFPQLQGEQDKKSLYKQITSTAAKMKEYYFRESPNHTLSCPTAEAFLLLGLIAYEINDPTRAYHAFETADSVDRGSYRQVDKIIGERESSRKVNWSYLKTRWISQYKKCKARVYGFNHNIAWDTLRVEIGVTYLERDLREDKIFQAIEWAEDYLNSELRNGKNEITLLLPPGMYRLKTENLDIYPARFEVEENSPSTIFDITPDRYFNLRVFFCKDTTETRIDTIFNQAQIDTTFLEDTSQVYQERPKKYRNYLFAEVDTTFKIVKTITVETQRVPISPKDMDIWKGDRRVLNFDHLAFGEYEFSDGKNFGISDEFKFKRFLPEDLRWDVPFEDRFSGEEIQVKSGDTFDLCVDLPRKTKRPVTEEELISQKRLVRPPTPFQSILYTTFMAALFTIFIYTIK